VRRTAWIILVALIVGAILGGPVMAYAGSQQQRDQPSIEMT
jgi:hypothetical protein